MRQRLTCADGPSRAAIDDVLVRGMLGDWLALRDAARGDTAVADLIVDVCTARKLYGTSPLWLEVIGQIREIDP